MFLPITRNFGQYQKLIASSFWKSRLYMANAISHKPPNIIIYSGNSKQVYEEHRLLLSRILESDCYTVYEWNDKCHSKYWIENTCVLILLHFFEENSQYLRNFLRNGGHCLSLPSCIPQDILSLLEESENQRDLVKLQYKNGGFVVLLENNWNPEHLRPVLENHFGMRCSTATCPLSVSKLSPVYLITDVKYTNNISHIFDGNILQGTKLKIHLTKDSSIPITEVNYPIVVQGVPESFKIAEYFQHLETRVIGRILLYSEVTTSTHFLLDNVFRLCDGLAIVARRQTSGRGRSGNVWLSPEGCAMFSMQLQFSLHSELGRHLSLLQHLVALAVVLAVRSRSEHDVCIHVKWPNDIYYGKTVKIGGVLVTTSIMGSDVVSNIGCGVNLDNGKPTTCINDILGSHDSERLSLENYLAIVFNQLESLLDLLNAGKIDDVLQLYHQNWLHSHSKVVVMDGTKEMDSSILGIDNYGFLRVRFSDGFITTVHPDGNSFDLIKGLIVPKSV